MQCRAHWAWTYPHRRNGTGWLIVAILEVQSFIHNGRYEGAGEFTSLSALTVQTPYDTPSIPANKMAVFAFQFEGLVHQPPSTDADESVV